MELSIPRQIRYDFLILLIGLGFLTIPYYFIYIHPFDIFPYHKLFLQSCFAIGSCLFLYGLHLIHKNYVLSIEMVFLESFVRKKQTINQLRESGIITTSEESLLHMTLRNQITRFLKENKST
jgi:hypothetical protein